MSDGLAYRDSFSKEFSNDSTNELKTASVVAVITMHLFTFGNNNASILETNNSKPSNSESIIITKNNGLRGGVQMSNEVRKEDLDNLKEKTNSDIRSLERLIDEKFSHTDTKIDNAINELKNEIEKSRNSNIKWSIGIIVTIILSILSYIL